MFRYVRRGSLVMIDVSTCLHRRKKGLFFTTSKRQYILYYKSDISIYVPNYSHVEIKSTILDNTNRYLDRLPCEPVIICVIVRFIRLYYGKHNMTKVVSNESSISKTFTWIGLLWEAHRTYHRGCLVQLYFLLTFINTT